MIYLFIAAISYGASLVGAICGVGGGVVIRPLMDAAGVFGISEIGFLSGCTVLSMTAFSISREARRNSLGTAVTSRTVILAAGAAIGGVMGKHLFTALRTGVGNDSLVGAVQSLVLLMMTAGTLLYTLLKDRIGKKNITNVPATLMVGALLGVISAFLGIGGGPMNIVVLSYCFSMKTKDAAKSSLFIILLSQITSLFTTFVEGTVPNVAALVLLMMMSMGILGGVAGRKLNDLIDQRTVDRLFMALLVVIMGITAYNFGGAIGPPGRG